MMSVTFSPNISDEVRDNTQALFDALASEQPDHVAISPELLQATKDGLIDVKAEAGCMRRGVNLTLLYLASSRETPEIAHYLLEHGADPEARNSFDDTPLHLAAQFGRLETAQLFLDHGVDIEIRSGGGGTPLWSAARSGNIDMVAYLLERGADLHVRNDVDESILHVAVTFGRPELCHYLAEQGAPINARAETGLTPLYHAAVYSPESATADALVQLGANLNARCQFDETVYEHNTSRFRETAQPTFDAWHNGHLEPQDLTKESVMQMLSVWPLADPYAEVPRFEHLEVIFSDPRWKDEHAMHKLALIQQVPGLTPREQRFLMGGHARAVIQKQNTTNPQELER